MTTRTVAWRSAKLLRPCAPRVICSPTPPQLSASPSSSGRELIRNLNLPLVAAALLSAACSGGSEQNSKPSEGDPLSGGTDDGVRRHKLAYAQQAPKLTAAHAEAFSFGHSVFDRNWVTAPATTEDMDGLGPRFNQRSCSSCHSHDGRSRPFDSAGAQLGMLFRLSVPGMDEHGGPLGDPTYGGQLRTSAILGILDDGTPETSYEEQPGTYDDGTSYSLQAPTCAINAWNYGDPQADLMISPRVPPFTIGLGLLEAISEDAILGERAFGRS